MIENWNLWTHTVDHGAVDQDYTIASSGQIVILKKTNASKFSKFGYSN